MAVTLLDDDRLFVKSAVGFEAGTSVPLELAFSPRTVDKHEVLVVPDTRAHVEWADHPLVTGEPHIVFYAAWPLAGPGGQVVGALCLVDQQPRHLSDTDRALLDDLAGWVETELAADADEVQAIEIQRRLLPHKASGRARLRHRRPLPPAFNVGGDYYDWHFLDDTMLQVTVADVMGKGLAAGVIAAGAAYRDAGHVAQQHPYESVRRTARACRTTSTLGHLRHDVHRRLRPQHGHLEYVDAGHGLAHRWCSPGSRTRQLAAADLPLGAQAATASWTSHETRLDPGDTLIVVSDGVLEAFADPTRRSAPRNLSSLGDDRPTRWPTGSWPRQPDSPLADDLTAVVIQTGDASVSRYRIRQAWTATASQHYGRTPRRLPSGALRLRRHAWTSTVRRPPRTPTDGGQP